MKKQILVAIAVSAFIVSCKQSTSKTEKVENPDGSVTTITTTESRTGLVDSAKIDKTKSDIKNTVDKTGDKIEQTAQKAKEDLNAAGKDIKSEANKVGKDIKSGAQEVGKDVKNTAAQGAQKVEDAAKKLKEDLKK